MIARAHRFHGYGSLRHVYARGQVVRGPLFALKYLRNDRRKTYRAAVVVSKKVHKSAVVRNRIRRRLYEALRLQLPKDIPPYDIVLIVYSESAATIPADELHAQVTAQLTKAKIIS
jgi:ribonuclease P protein component